MSFSPPAEQGAGGQGGGGGGAQGVHPRAAGAGLAARQAARRHPHPGYGMLGELLWWGWRVEGGGEGSWAWPGRPAVAWRAAWPPGPALCPWLVPWQSLSLSHQANRSSSLPHLLSPLLLHPCRHQEHWPAGGECRGGGREAVAGGGGRAGGGGATRPGELLGVCYRVSGFGPGLPASFQQLLGMLLGPLLRGAEGAGGGCGAGGMALRALRSLDS